MNRMIKFIWAGFACCLLAFSGCSDNASQSGKDKGPGAKGRYLTIKGSDTMVHLVSSWAEQFMQSHPDADISVTGGGSGTGIAALINDTTDICAASRAINEKELQLAAHKGITPVEHRVALDGIAVIVNPANPVAALSMEELRKIFTGTVDNWQQVGGPDKSILVLSRESSSGTFTFFQEHVLDKMDYTPKARFLPGTSAVVQNISADAWAIGYVGLGYTADTAGSVKVLAVSAKPGETAIMPSEQNVLNGTYAIARPLFLYTNGKEAGLTKDFIDYTLSAPGQKVVRETGYVTIQ